MISPPLHATSPNYLTQCSHLQISLTFSSSRLTKSLRDPFQYYPFHQHRVPLTHFHPSAYLHSTMSSQEEQPQEQRHEELEQEQQFTGEGDDAEQLAQLERELQGLDKESTELAGTQQTGGSKPSYDASAQAEVDQRSVYIGNVDYSCDEETLRAFFAPLAITRITIPKDQSGRAKGYAYAEFATADDSTQALLLSERELKGRPLHIQTKRTNTAGVSRSRGRGGRGGRGGFAGGRGAPMPHHAPPYGAPYAPYPYPYAPPPYGMPYAPYPMPPAGGHGGHRGGHRGGNRGGRGGRQ